MESAKWQKVNLDLIAKSIAELSYEEVLRPQTTPEGFLLKTHSGVDYHFHGHKTVWDFLRIDSTTLTRNGRKDIDAAQFFLDIQEETGMDDIILGNFLEEMQNTLFSDMQLQERIQELNVTEMISWDGEQIQTILQGHPKILLNKGRMGWTADDLRKYAPEANAPFQLFWIAVKTDHSNHEVLEESFTPHALSEFLSLLLKKDISLEHYSIMPVHPWQWARYIEVQYNKEINSGSIVPLGIHGDFYRPQISIRTLSNFDRPKKNDIKLPLSILNTSCVRGLPADSVRMGNEISHKLEELCSQDELLENVRILKERPGIVLPHEYFSQIKKIPYRYNEFLACVWRESAVSKLGTSEKAILCASLFHQDAQKNSLIGAYIKKSGATFENWLRALFETTIVPLYHLQTEYGIGLVAHGQNIVLILKDHFPVGMILKDFHGDLRLSSQLPDKGEKYFGGLKNSITNLPPRYLLHDLITGHLVTVQRFISAVMKESDGMDEEGFYSILAQVLAPYNKPSADLLTETFERVLLNKVRFQIGYADSDQRPLPILGTPIKNPLSLHKRVHP